MDFQMICPGCLEEKGTAATCPFCAYHKDTPPESLLHLSPGTVLQGKYLIGRALGQGGFGITYLALDTALTLKLAVKEYLPQYLVTRSSGRDSVTVYKSAFAEEFSYGLAKFLEEGRMLARFNEHPNIVTVRDFFEANNTAYLVMNYHQGLTLQAYLERQGGIIAYTRAVKLFMPVLDALKEVHAAGILHRDISPDNILISEKGRVILIDFGAARQAITEQSRSLSVIMKAGYSPVEQYQGQGKQGPWTDIYAVAATIYRCITGDVPPEALERLEDSYIIRPSALGADISPAQEKVLLKALELKSKDRYNTVETFQSALMGAGTEQGLEEKYAGVVGGNPFEQLDDGVKAEEPAAVEKQYWEEQKKGALKDLPPQAAVVADSLGTPGIAREKEAKPGGFSFGRKALKYVAGIVLGMALFIGAISATSLFGGGEDVADPAGPVFEEGPQDRTALNNKDVDQNETVHEDEAEEVEPIYDQDEPVQETKEAEPTYGSAVIAGLDADYYIDYEQGTIPIGDLPIGARVVDPSWEWEFRLGINFSGIDYDGNPTPPGEVKPVTWIVVAYNHYDLEKSHVTLLTEGLIGLFAFDDSTNRGHQDQHYGHNHWKESGTTNATRGLRPWLNSDGIHSGEGFFHAFSDHFKRAVLTTKVPNREWFNGDLYSTADSVFIPSTTELGDLEHTWTYRMGTTFPLFTGATDEHRVALLGGRRMHYWLRSPFSDFGYSVRNVSSNGELYHYGFRYNYANYGGNGVRPALNLKSEILVSEINP